MLAYLIVAVIPLLVGNLYNKKLKKNKLLASKKRRNYILMAALPMFFLIAFRNQSLGADTGVYLDHFERMVDTPWDRIFENTRMEEGYIVFVKILTLFTSNALVYQVICVTIYLLAVTSFVNQLDDDPFFVLFLFATMGMYTFMFTGVRQCLAISICLFSFRFIRKRKIVPFALLMALAFTFHKSSILFVAAYLIYRRRLNWLNISIYLLILAIALLFLDVIQEWFNDQLEYDYDIEGNAGGLISSIIFIGITILTIVLVGKSKSLTVRSQGLINIGLIATLFWILRLATRIAERPSFYFLMFLFAAFTYAINNIKNTKDKSAIKIIVIILALGLFIYRLAINQTDFVPYMFYSF